MKGAPDLPGGAGIHPDDPLASLARARVNTARLRAWLRRGDQDQASRWLDAALADLHAAEAQRTGAPWLAPGIAQARRDLDLAMEIEP